MPRSTARRRLLPVAVFLLLLLAVAAWIGLRALAAQRHLEQARDRLAVAREALLDRDITAAQAAIISAGDDTDRARSLTSDPLWRLAAAVPVAGRSLEAAGGLAEAADDLARGVLPLALQAAKDIDPATLRRPDGSIDLGLVRAATPPVVASADRAETVLVEVTDLPTDGVVTAIADAQAELAGQVDELAGVLRGSAQALEIAPTLLGEDRLRRYLVLVQQTSESRGTGGIVGGYVALEAEAGQLRVIEAGSNADLNRSNGEIPVPEGVPADFVDLYAPGGAFRFWQNANRSPNLPVAAQVFEARWQARGGQPLDGVVVLDSIALEALLQGSGPIDVGETSVAPDELVEYLAIGQYRDFAPVSDLDGTGRSVQRKDQLDEVTRAAAQRLVSGGGDTKSLLRGLADAISSGHLRMASDDPALQPLLARAGIDGALPRGNAPVAFAVVDNITAGKLDYFLDRKVRYTAGPCEGETRRSTIEVTLTNQAPEAGLPPYLTVRATAADPAGQSTSHAVQLSVYGTPGADLLSASIDGQVIAGPGAPEFRVINAQESGLPVWLLQVELPRAQPVTVTLELEEPVVSGAARVPEQPLARPLDTSVDVPVCS